MALVIAIVVGAAIAVAAAAVLLARRRARRRHEPMTWVPPRPGPEDIARRQADDPSSPFQTPLD